MSMLLARDGMLCVLDCYHERHIVKSMGAVWHKDSKLWVMPLTPSNLETALERLKNPIIEASLEEALEAKLKKEARLSKIAKLAKKDAPVKMMVPGLKLPLFNYQKIGVMFSLANSDGVLIADEMGLGKTVQGIASACYKKYHNGCKRCFVIVPAAVKWNWPIEVEKFTDEPYVVIDGVPDERVRQWAGKVVCRRQKSGKYKYVSGEPFFYIVNYELITEDLFGGRTISISEDDPEDVTRKKVKRINAAKQRATQLKHVKSRVWGCIIIDEAHYLKSHTSKRSSHVKQLKGVFRVALTGTPLDGKLEELHSVMGFVKPGLFTSKHRFLQRHATYDFWGKIVGYKRIDEVREKIRPFFIRRLKKDVMKDLPEKTYQNKYVVLSAQERKIYEAIADRKHEVTVDTEAMVKVIRCKQFCDHPVLIDESCKSSKMNLFLEIVEELVKYNGEKVIVFTQYKQMLDIIDDELRQMKLRFLRIDGDTTLRRRAEMQEEFNTDPKIDAIIGTEAMSEGLNLQGATYVINYDDNWSPSKMHQREDRAHRQGQKNAVTVINFIVRDTIEERIREVLYDKEVVSAETLGDETDEMVMKRLGPQEIAKLV